MKNKKATRDDAYADKRRRGQLEDVDAPRFKPKTQMVPAPSGALVAGVNDLSPEDIKSITENAAGAGFGFLKLGQATSGAVTSSRAKIGEFTVGQDDRNLGDTLHVVPYAYSYRAQLWGRLGKDKGKILAESRTRGSETYKRIEGNRSGESGFEFLFWHPDEKLYSVFSFGKWKNRQIGQAIALRLTQGGALILKSVVKPGKPGNPPIANLSLEVDDSVYPVPKNLEAVRKDYLDGIEKFKAEELEAAGETAAPAGRPR